MDILRRGRLLADGYSPAELRRGVRTGGLVVLRRGAYLDPSAKPAAPEAWHALEVRAAAPTLAPEAVISHASAAALFGLPLWGVRLDRVHVTRCRPHGGRVDPRLHVHSASFDADEVVVLDGIAVTSVARTVVDLARSLPFEEAVSVADAALHRKLLTPDELAAAVVRATRRPGVAAARRVVAFADSRSESPGESRSRVRMRRFGLPEPELQMPIRTRYGIYYADFGWSHHRAIGEFDGLIKYGALLRPGQDPGEAVVAEKRREDAIRDEDWRVARWIWSELEPFDAVARRIERSLRR
jgi:predicted transcriptional regulator of viral defense system